MRYYKILKPKLRHRIGKAASELGLHDCLLVLLKRFIDDAKFKINVSGLCAGFADC